LTPKSVEKGNLRGLLLRNNVVDAILLDQAIIEEGSYTSTIQVFPAIGIDILSTFINHSRIVLGRREGNNRRVICNLPGYLLDRLGEDRREHIKCGHDKLLKLSHIYHDGVVTFLNLFIQSI